MDYMVVFSSYSCPHSQTNIQQEEIRIDHLQIGKAIDMYMYMT